MSNRGSTRVAPGSSTYHVMRVLLLQRRKTHRYGFLLHLQKSPLCHRSKGGQVLWLANLSGETQHLKSRASMALPDCMS